MTEPVQCPCGGPLTYVEVHGVYDGALYVRCQACGRAAPRFPAGHWLHDRATPYIERANAERAA